MRSRGLTANSAPGNGLNGIRLNLHGTSRTRRTSAPACAGESFTPSSITYSKVTKSRGATSRYRRHAAIRSASGCLRLIGTSLSRSASSGACRLTASATGHSAASRSICGTRPDVETVTRRRDSPYALSSTKSLRAGTTQSRFASGSPIPIITTLVIGARM